VNHLQVTARFRVKDPAKFRALAADCLRSVREKDTGTRQYDWFLSEDGKECVVRETYDSSEAILGHVANLGDLLPRILEVGELSLEICGSPSPELVAALEPLDSRTYSYFQGL